MGRRRTLRLVGVLTAVAVVAATVLAVASPAPAGSAPEVILVQGQFQTQTPNCPDDPTNEFCAVDALTGDIQGSNRLALRECQPSPQCRENPASLPVISYVDDVVTITQYGRFTGNEHGQIHPLAGGDLNAVDHVTGPCGSELFLHNQGVINVTTLLDSGTYTGVLILRRC